MKYTKKTHRRKNSKKRLTRKKTKGGARRCSTETNFDRFVIRLWTTVQRYLRVIDDRWKFDQHENQTHRSCNLWGWLKCHTSRDYDTHWDLYFINRNRIGLSLTFNNTHNYSRASFDVDYDGIYDEDYDEYELGAAPFDNLARELADWVESTYWDWVYDIAGWERRDCH